MDQVLLTEELDKNQYNNIENGLKETINNDGGDSTSENSKSMINKKFYKSSDNVIQSDIPEELRFVKMDKKSKKSPDKSPSKSPKKANRSDNLLVLQDNGNNFVPTPTSRKDYKGTYIQKKSKKHKVVFIDQVDKNKKLTDVQEIENFKMYNKEAVRYGNNSKDQDQSGAQCSCACVIF